MSKRPSPQARSAVRIAKRAKAWLAAGGFGKCFMYVTESLRKTSMHYLDREFIAASTERQVAVKVLEDIMRAG